jgi:hypothetical protein
MDPTVIQYELLLTGASRSPTKFSSLWATRRAWDGRRSIPLFLASQLPLNPPEQRRLFKGGFYSFAVAFHVKNLEGNTTSISLAIMII